MHSAANAAAQPGRRPRPTASLPGLPTAIRPGARRYSRVHGKCRGFRGCHLGRSPRV